MAEPTSIGGTGLIAQSLIIRDGGTPFPLESVAPTPIRTLNLFYERAFQLATMPRSNWDEKIWSAFWGTIGSFPGFVEAMSDGFKNTPFSLGAFDFAQGLLFFGFLIWFVIGRLNMKSKRTALEYLNELYSLPPPSSSASNSLWTQFWQT